jgi:hypothetical protein
MDRLIPQLTIVFMIATIPTGVASRCAELNDRFSSFREGFSGLSIPTIEQQKQQFMQAAVS